MDNWKEDLREIAKLVTGASTATCKGDFIALAKDAGGAPESWRDAVFIWAKSHGVIADTWRNQIIGISLKLLPEWPPLTWRRALRFIMLHYRGTPPQVFFFLSDPPRVSDSEYRVLADGVIQAHQIIFA